MRMRSPAVDLTWPENDANKTALFLWLFATNFELPL